MACLLCLSWNSVLLYLDTIQMGRTAFNLQPREQGTPLSSSCLFGGPLSSNVTHQKRCRSRFDCRGWLPYTDSPSWSAICSSHLFHCLFILPRFCFTPTMTCALCLRYLNSSSLINYAFFIILPDVFLKHIFKLTF